MRTKLKELSKKLGYSEICACGIRLKNTIPWQNENTANDWFYNDDKS